jgi:hypothetical protein
MADATGGYRSPVSKLIRFFRRSRDQWKQKCRDAKQCLKRAKQRAQQIAASRDRWKLHAQQGQEELLRAREELEELKKMRGDAVTASVAARARSRGRQRPRKRSQVG